jgi:hypothetical protein
MGGYGSGRAAYRQAIEHCVRLSARDLFLLRKDGGSLTKVIPFITSARERGQTTIHIPCFATPATMISFTTEFRGQANEQSIWAEAKPMPNGGVRFLFVCPHCHQHRLQLVLPPHSVQWSCRCCFNLTYVSCNESGKYSGLGALLLRLGHPELALEGARVLLQAESDRRRATTVANQRAKRREYEAIRRARLAW